MDSDYKRKSGSEHGRSHYEKKIKTERSDSDNDEERERRRDRRNHREDRDHRDRRDDRDRRDNRDNRDFKTKKREYNDDRKYEYGKKSEEPAAEPIEKEKPSLEVSGNLLKDTNTFNGVVVKYVEPPEARKPRRRWRLYCFKGDQELPFYQIHRQSAYLFGRDRLVADIPVDHPSCSKQHAVFQYRLIDYKRKDGTNGRVIKPYIIDLGSTNGTYINNSRIEAQRYYELKEKDAVKFGFSSRDFILLHEESKNDLDNDDYNSDQSDATASDKEEEVETKKEKSSKN
jgi:smad nuclear-interacting protein 1